MGLLLVTVVHTASLQDCDGAKLVLDRAHRGFPRLERIWADGGYAGKLVQWVEQTYPWAFEIIRRTSSRPDFQVRPHLWIVERTFGWLSRYRRLSKDYECLPQSSEAMIRLMLRRLACQNEPQLYSEQSPSSSSNVDEKFLVASSHF